MPNTLPRLLLAALLLCTGAAQARGPWRANEANTQGWRLMSPAERIEHQAKVRQFKAYEECHAYQLEHHRLMEARASAQGLTLGPGRRDICAHLLTSGARP
ncbi:MAG TPA: hypothetical protein VJ576_02155 [Rhodocyclaceae bacterium]|nr:hypothetical protein [Rhodocyclaceae bacterium]